MDKASITLQQFLSVEKLARSSKWKRLKNAPGKYLYAMFFRKMVHPLFKKKSIVSTKLFWDQKIKIYLPACMDLYLVNGKSDDSEIRLTKFFIKNIKEGDHFLDAGAHVGYYSLLAAQLSGNKGKIVSVEPSPSIKELLDQNIEKNKNISAVHAALLDKEGEIDFFEFPIMYSEYNTIDAKQYSGLKWNRSVNHKKVTVKTTSGDILIRQYDLHPVIIKIDVEGAENKVVQSLQDHLAKNKPYLVMEFVCSERNNEAHQQADIILQSLGYSAYRIDDDGELAIIGQPVKEYVDSLDLESDNIVYHK